MPALAESPAPPGIAEMEAYAFEPEPIGPRPGFPTAAMLAAVGDPPDGTFLTEEQALTLATEFAFEWVDGRLSYLPMATEVHQRIVIFFLDVLRQAARGRGHDPVTLVAPFFVRVPNRMREPDVVMLLSKTDPRRDSARWDGADVAVEVVSDSDPNRDLRRKRVEYAAAGISEYWIVDPRPGHRRIAVLVLEGGAYRGEFVGEGGVVESALLPGFTLAVAECLDPE